MSGTITKFIRSHKASQGLLLRRNLSTTRKAVAWRENNRMMREKERHAEVLVEDELYERGRVSQLMFEINGQ